MPTRVVATFKNFHESLLFFYWWNPNAIAHGMLAASLEDHLEASA